jgi:hypothetical protein
VQVRRDVVLPPVYRLPSRRLHAPVRPPGRPVPPRLGLPPLGRGEGVRVGGEVREEGAPASAAAWGWGFKGLIMGFQGS